MKADEEAYIRTKAENWATNLIFEDTELRLAGKLMLRLFKELDKTRKDLEIERMVGDAMIGVVV